MKEYNITITEGEKMFAMGTEDGTIGEIQSRIKRNQPWVTGKRGRKFWISAVGEDKADLRKSAKRWSDTIVKYSVRSVDMSKIEGDMSKLK